MLLYIARGSWPVEPFATEIKVQSTDQESKSAKSRDQVIYIRCNQESRINLGENHLIREPTTIRHIHSWTGCN